jgi:hypothetical protein
MRQDPQDVSNLVDFYGQRAMDNAASKTTTTRNTSTTMVIARWESVGGAHWVEAIVTPDSFRFGGYRANNACGSTGTEGIPDTLAAVQKKVDSGYFLPDAAKLPMRRVL